MILPKKLLDILKALPADSDVNLSLSDKRMQVKSGKSRFNLQTLPAEDYPRLAVADATTVKFSVQQKLLKSLLSLVQYAMAQQDIRYYLNGLLMVVDGHTLRLVATDGHRLVRYRRVDVASSNGASLIIPRKALNLLKSTLPSENVPVAVEFNQSNAYFKFSNIKMICRLIDERFPDYENVIPTENPNRMNIDRMEFLGSLRRIAIYANKTTHQVRLKLTGSELMISAEDLDFSNEANERLSCDHEGEDIEIGFNAKFLVEMLNNLSCKEVSLKFSAPNRAGLILPATQDANEDILMLVMPVMLNNYV